MLATTNGRRSARSVASPTLAMNRHVQGAGKPKSMANLRFLESMKDLHSHLDHMRHSNRLITCDSEASKVTQGALATQIALKQSEANVVLRDTSRCAKQALALEKQVDKKQKRIDALQVDIHGAELRNRSLQTTCVDAIANIEELAEQLDGAKKEFANASQEACALKLDLAKAKSQISALENTEATTKKNLRGAEHQLAAKVESYKVQVRSLEKRGKDLDAATQRVQASIRAEEDRAEAIKVSEAKKLGEIGAQQEQLLDQIGELLDKIKANIKELAATDESTSSLLQELEAQKDAIATLTQAIHEASRRENDAQNQLALLEQRKAAAEHDEEAKQKQAENLAELEAELKLATAAKDEELRKVEMEASLQQTEARAAADGAKNRAAELSRISKELDLTNHEVDQLKLLREQKNAELGLGCEDVHTVASSVKKLENRRSDLKDEQAFQDERIVNLESLEKNATESQLSLSEQVCRKELELTQAKHEHSNEIIRLQFEIDNARAAIEKRTKRTRDLEDRNAELVHVHTALVEEADQTRKIVEQKVQALTELVERLRDEIQEGNSMLEDLQSQAKQQDDKRLELELKTQRVMEQGINEARDRQLAEGEAQIALVTSSGRANNEKEILETTSREAAALAESCDIMSIEIATKVEAISEAAAEMDNLNNELADRKLQHAEQAQVINSLRATLKLALAEMDVRTQKVQDAKKDVVEAQANVATDEKFLSDLQELASDKFDQHIAAIEERAARRVELATKKAEAQQDLMKMSSAASALQSMSQRVEAIRNDLAEALEGQRSSRAELRARVQQQELDGRRAVATLTEQTENAVQTALATQEELAQQQLANNETAEQLERVRQRAQATEESLDDAQSKRAHASARLGAAVEEVGHMDQHLHNPQQQLVVAGKEEDLRSIDSKILELKVKAEEYDTGEGKFQPAIEDLERTNQDLRDEIASRRAAALRLKETILEVQRQYERVEPASTAEELRAQLEQSQAQQAELSSRLVSLLEDKKALLLDSQKLEAEVRDAPENNAY